MNRRTFACLAAFAAGGLWSPVLAADNIDQLAAQATVDYSTRLKAAEAELTQVRERIASEKAPLLDAMRSAEDRLAAAESALQRLKTAQDRGAETKAALQKESADLHRNLTYVGSLARDAVNSVKDGLISAEDQVWGSQVDDVQRGFEGAAADARPVLASLNLLVSRLERGLGGYTAPGRAVQADTNVQQTGTLAFFGPESFFLPADNSRPGALRVHEGAEAVFSHPVAAWEGAQAALFFRGELGAVPGDGSGGKALRLAETKGSIWDHVRKGGLVSYAIVVVGCVALLLIVAKAIDLARLRVGSPAAARRFLSVLAIGSRPAVDEAFKGVTGAVRELYAVGLAGLGEPKAVLEEQLWAVMLRIRLHAERRLPLLSVIAVAAPLMGLLGTVTGMVRTFALITVFGTGNAGKLASGISEVLVSTELGLIVAIPSLVAHGFLASRTQKKLAQLECHALEFVTAAQQRAGRSGVAPPPPEPAPSVS